MPPEQIGPYRIVEKLGSGGMGDVYLGEHVDTGTKAAIKVLTASLAREGGFVERFTREVDSMRKLDNPRIVKLYESGVDGENYYYAMEYVPGETLLGLMRDEKRMPWRKAIQIAIQVCQALKSAHDAGIIHRDLKPSNLLVADGVVKLTDFGVAQVFAGSRLTVTGGIIGTAEYMSPEQAQGKRATKQSDLYSLGALLYAMITGRTPFSGSTAIEVIQKHKFGLFDRPGLYVPDLPKRVEDTICKLLEKDPAKRFPDALVLLRHLEQLLRIEDSTASGGLTLADSMAVERDAPTVVVTTGDLLPTDATSTGSSRGAGPATLMQSLMRAELDEMNRGHWLSGLFNTLFVQVALLLLIIGGGVYFFWPRQVSPQERFEQGVALMQEQPGPKWLAARREYFQPLVDADPQTWTDKVAPYLREIEVYELTRSTRGIGRGKSTPTESESQRLLQLAQRDRETGDPARAERRLTALRALLAGNDAESKVYEAAGHLLDDLQRERGDGADRDKLLRDSLDRAAKLAAEGKAAEARGIWQGIFDLYADDPAARDFVAKARKALDGS
jgi:serine/threonine-protein kinase